MDAVDWSGLSVLAALVVACAGYLARQINRVDSRIDRLDDKIDDRFNRLDERYVRHLEMHGTH